MNGYNPTCIDINIFSTEFGNKLPILYLYLKTLDLNHSILLSCEVAINEKGVVIISFKSNALRAIHNPEVALFTRLTYGTSKSLIMQFQTFYDRDRYWLTHHFSQISFKDGNIHLM